MFASLVIAAVASASAPSAFAASSSDLEHRLGNLSPWSQAPIPQGLTAELPAQCSVSQVMLMHRHGSRYPLASELVFITNLVSKIQNASAVLATAKLPDELKFITSYKSTLGHDDLTAVGRRQLFDSGVDFRLQYGGLLSNATLPVTVLAGGQDRVIESAQWWQQGFFGRTANITSKFAVIAEDTKTVSWITPMDTCPKWQYAYGNNKTIEWGAHYLPPITSRLNAAIKSSLPKNAGVSLNFTDADIHGGLYACAYDLANFGSLKLSPWCSVFTSAELKKFEYELDLLMEGAFGYGLPGPMGPLLGGEFVRLLVNRFTTTSTPLYLEFGHDTTIDMALTALGLAKDTPALSASPSHNTPPADRKWSTSTQVPFAARMVWEKFSCTKGVNGIKANTPQIRLVLNASPFDISSICKSSKYGSCSLADFVGSKVIKTSTSKTWGDVAWNTTCGNPNI